ncbi:hypothetical protein ACH3VR_19215 [Microbacterium sp. B2969]|uniref:Fimbrial assembly protein n=1 Tax=Microbacterium alkaliflavum TaxID=3248839 RepID=A0ABW7QC93_9MICO
MAKSMVPALAGVPRINLMPKMEIIRRERDALIRGWVWGVFAAILVTLAIIAAAFAFKWVSDQRLVAEQAHTNDLLVQLSALSEVSSALATQSELESFRSDAMVTDFAWAPVMASVKGILPSDVVFTGFSMKTGGTPVGDDPTAEPGLVGTLTLDSPTPIDIVGTVRSLRQVDGVLAADGQAVTSSNVIEGHYAYEITVQFDQSVYSGQYEADAEGAK